MNFQYLELQQANGIATLALNRPEKRNAMSDDMRSEFIEALEYVQVARTRGERRLYVACMEILPNMLNPVLTDLGLRFGYIVLLLSGMSFLGLGVQPPDADLGSLVRENIGGLNQGALAIIIPALAIGTLTIGVNLLIDYMSSRRSRRTGGH